MGMPSRAEAQRWLNSHKSWEGSSNARKNGAWNVMWAIANNGGRITAQRDHTERGSSSKRKGWW